MLSSRFIWRLNVNPFSHHAIFGTIKEKKRLWSTVKSSLRLKINKSFRKVGLNKVLLVLPNERTDVEILDNKKPEEWLIAHMLFHPFVVIVYSKMLPNLNHLEFYNSKLDLENLNLMHACLKRNAELYIHLFVSFKVQTNHGD